MITAPGHNDCPHNGEEQEIDILLRISQTIGVTLDLNTVLRRLLTGLVHLLAAQSVMVIFYTEAEDEAEIVTLSGLSRAFQTLRYPLAGSMAGWVAEHKRPLRVLRISPEEWPTSWRLGAQLGVSLLDVSVIMVPLWTQEKVVGCLTVAWEPCHDITDSEERLLEMVAAQATIALTNARLYQEKEHALRRARESEERYRNLFENASDGIACLTAKGIITSVNRRLEDMLGWSREEMIGRKYCQFYTPSSLIAEEERMRRLQDGERISAIHEIELMRKDGTVVPVEAHTRFLNIEAEPIKVLAILRDITARKHMENELRKVKDAAEAANHAKSEFLANMSHEIRTPMNGIIGLTGLALDTDLTAEQREYLGLVKTSADSLLTILNDILDFSKIEAGKLTLDPIAFSLRDSVRETMQTFALRAHQKDLELRWRIGSDVPDQVVGDVGRLRQVMVNLIGNAIKFTERGEVVVEVQRSTFNVQDKTSPCQTWSLEPGTLNSCLLHFSVRDTGIGIPADKQQTVFAPFSQADGSMTRKYGGTGLGLAISSQLITLMGGQLWVESVVGQGSTFHFTVQLTAPQEAEREAEGQAALCVRAPQPAVSSKESYQLSILLAEDNAVNQKLAVRVLEKGGHQVVVASNGKEALAALERQKFDVVLMDVQMPEMNGFEATAAIRTKERSTKKHIPIIAMTAHAMKGDRERCLAAGMDGYLTKPLHPQELHAAIHNVVPKLLLNTESM